VNNGTSTRPGSTGSTPRRVLMADPDESLPPLYREPLLREGFQLVTAVSGLECLARLRERVPDVLVLEPHLPWGGGDGILAMLDGTPELAHIPVMVLTSCRDAHVLQGVARFPISDYHVKPLAPDRLAGRLRSLLDHPGQCFTMAEQSGRLECLIDRRAGGRVRNLRVEIVDGRVLVSGCSESRHVKQLVAAAVLDAFEAAQSEPGRVELEIDVCGDCESTLPEMCFNSGRKWEVVRCTHDNSW
jgi:CheY-like chemotaxis protein